MGRNIRYSKEEKIKACNDYLNGNATFHSIAASIGTTPELVRRWCLTYKIHGETAFETITQNRSYTKEFKHSVIEEYLSGKSLPNLGSKYNISPGVIHNWLKKYYNGIEIKDYDPKGDVYTMKSRKTTFEERLEIVNWVLANDLNYKDAADKFGIKYALVYQWVKKYKKDGLDGLKHFKKGPKPKSEINEESLSEVEKLKLELEREKALRERAEFKLEVLKKKEEFERKLRSRK